MTNLIQDDNEAQLALFLSKTLTNAIMLYRQGGPSAGPIAPPGNKPGPIGPPRERGVRGAATEGAGVVRTSLSSMPTVPSPADQVSI